MKENKKKKTILFSIIAIVTLIVAVAGITYAYFTADTTGNEAEVNVSAETAKKRDVFSTSGTPTIILNVTSDKMQQSEAETVAVSDTKTLSVSLEAGSGHAYCTYDLTYIPDEEFVGSGLYREFTIEGTNGTKSFGAIDILGSGNINLGTFRIADDYENSSVATSVTWSITGKFNNLNADQNNSINKTFSGKIEATNVVCKNGEEENPINIVSGNVETIGSEIAIGDEHFYIISTDDENVTLFAKYNLNIGGIMEFDKTITKEDCLAMEGTSYALNRCVIRETILPSSEKYNLQSPEALGGYNLQRKVGNVPFSSVINRYWIDSDNRLLSKYGSSYPAYVYDEGASIKRYIDNYKMRLEGMYDIDIEEARLIKYEELVDLGCNSSSATCNTDTVTNNNRQWIYNSYYWTGSAQSQNNMWVVTETAIFYFSNPDASIGIGARPVIVLDKSLLENL